MKKIFCYIVLAVFLVQFSSAALGISPARQNIDFAPGVQHTFTYTVLCDDPYQEIFLYAEGDLAQYVTLSKQEIKGQDSFSVTLKLPQTIELPGTHTLLIGAKEKPNEDSFLNTAINIRATISIFVPYPGRYASISLDIPSGNINSSIPVEAKVKNLGKEDLEVTTRIDFFSQSAELVKSMEFEPTVVKSGATRSFGRYLDTGDLLAGNYFAEAIASYGNVINASTKFRIGELFVNVTNYTTHLGVGGIKKFDVGVESFWNDPVQSVYASVNVSNETYSTYFQTPFASLVPWGTTVLSGFIDTSNLKGEYFSDIVLYYGEHTSITYGTLNIVGAGIANWVLYLVAGLVAIVALVVIIWHHYKKANKSNRKKRK